jgi:hypothetical protein
MRMTRHHPSRVAPFGHPRITARRRLPAAFRSPPRPSSALGAQASPARSLPLGAPPREPRAIRIELNCHYSSVLKVQELAPVRRHKNGLISIRPFFETSSVGYLRLSACPVVQAGQRLNLLSSSCENRSSQPLSIRDQARPCKSKCSRSAVFDTFSGE